MADEKVEGETQTCDTCKESITCRLNDYGGKYPAKLQWQDNTSNKAHYTIEGICKKVNPKDESKPTHEVECPPGHIIKEPTGKELRERFYALSIDSQLSEPFKIIKDYIETREACESLGITHPATIGMIWNNRVRDRQR